MTTTVPQCMFCKHHHGDLTCDAFPEEIPEDILLNDFDHIESYDGDNGILFELKE